MSSRSAQPLGTPQLAFVRAWAEGIDPAVAWERFLYLDGVGDARRARSELARIREELQRVARLNGRPDIAALLSRDPEAIVDKASKTPSLDEFRRDFDEDFYSEAELLALYQETHGKTDARSAARRRQRLRERLGQALQWLQERVARPPLPDDPTGLWLDERVAARLAAVGIRTLSDLHFWVRSRGFHWYRPVPRLGPDGAARLVRWLREHQSALGPLPASALVAPSQLDRTAALSRKATAMAPLERFALPSDDRCGERGGNRAPTEQCRIPARNDLQAVQAWLGLRPTGSHTWRAYRREAERFLLWAVLERRKALSSLDGDDCTAYRAFLGSPAAGWVAPRNTQRWGDDWRPFEGPCSERSQLTAVTILRAMCQWLVRNRYLAVNPWDDVPRTEVTTAPAGLRALSEDEWGLVQTWLAQEPPGAATSRLNFLLQWAYLTGMRLAELSAARLSWLRLPNGDTAAAPACIRVRGKQGKCREVFLPPAALQALGAYLSHRAGAADLSSVDPEAPLLAHLDGEAALSSARIYDIVTDAFERCAAWVYLHDKAAAQRIQVASTHWLRHTFAMHAAARGVTQDAIKQALGHESLATTAAYVSGKPEQARQRTQVVLAAANSLD